MSENPELPKRDEAIQRLLEAEAAYQRARADDYLSRLIRDEAMAQAHRAGLSSSEISELVGGIGQPNVVRSRRRAATKAGTLPQGLISPIDAVRASGMGPGDFIAAVREGRITGVEIRPGVHAFRAEDVDRLASSSPSR